MAQTLSWQVDYCAMQGRFAHSQNLHILIAANDIVGNMFLKSKNDPAGSSCTNAGADQTLEFVSYLLQHGKAECKAYACSHGRATGWALQTFTIQSSYSVAAQPQWLPACELWLPGRCAKICGLQHLNFASPGTTWPPPCCSLKEWRVCPWWGTATAATGVHSPLAKVGRRCC